MSNRASSQYSPHPTLPYLKLSFLAWRTPIAEDDLADAPRLFEQCHARCQLVCPREAEARRLGVLRRCRRHRSVAPASEEALLVVQSEGVGGREGVLAVLDILWQRGMAKRMRRRLTRRMRHGTAGRQIRGKAVGDLIGHDDSNVVFPSQATEPCAHLGDLSTTFGKRPSGSRGRCSVAGWLVKLCAEIGGNAIDDEQSDIVLGDGHGDLVAEDVILCFEVMDVSAVDPTQGGFLTRGEEAQSRVVVEKLHQARGLERCFCRYVERRMCAIGRGVRLKLGRKQKS